MALDTLGSVVSLQMEGHSFGCRTSGMLQPLHFKETVATMSLLPFAFREYFHLNILEFNKAKYEVRCLDFLT